MTGAFKNYTGSVLFNNIPIGNYAIDSIRSQTGILLSQQDIFNGTIWENITMGNKDVTYDEVTNLVKQCGLSDFVDALPKGYDTLLDPTGNKLSSTVRQDILLLRALLGRRRLLLLEEPLASLESGNKRQVAKSMLGAENATVIIATNEIDIAKQCDLVIYLEKGTIKAAGNWNQVALLIN
jgi:ABC-type bacteriocin/lantibiotic exporter with double-glycine peptidase domain